MTIILQLSAIFAFGVVITGIVSVGIVRAREHARREQMAAARDNPQAARSRLRLVG